MSVAGIAEARLPVNDCRPVDSSFFFSRGDQHINGIAMVCPQLVPSKLISSRLLLARFTHKHGYLIHLPSLRTLRLSRQGGCLESTICRHVRGDADATRQHSDYGLCR